MPRGSQTLYTHIVRSDGSTYCRAETINRFAKPDKATCARCKKRYKQEIEDKDISHTQRCKSCGKPLDTTSINQRHITCHRKQAIIDRDFAQLEANMPKQKR